MDLLPDRRIMAVDTAWTPSAEVTAGTEIPVKVFLRPYRGERIEQNLTVKIPADLPKGEHRILLSDAVTLNRLQSAAVSSNRYLDLPETVSLLNQERGNNRLYVSVVQRRPTYYSEDKTLPALPLSVLNVLQSQKSAGRALDRNRRERRGRAFHPVRSDGHRKLSRCRLRFGRSDSHATGPVSLRASVCLCAIAAVDTKTWEQGSMEDFDQGTLQHLSLSSDGRLAVAPRLREVFDSSVAVLWAVARDSKGTIYAGGGSLGGSRAKLFSIDSQGRGKLLAELDGIAVQAIAIDRQDRVYAATRRTGKSIAWTRPAKPTCSTIPRPSTSGRWRSPRTAIYTSPPETTARFIA